MAGKPSIAFQDITDRTERMRLLASAMRYTELGKPIPDFVRDKLSQHDLDLVEEYRKSCVDDFDLRR